MNSLYAVSIRGTMFFVEGHLSEAECFQLDQLANQLVTNGLPQIEPTIQHERFLLLAKRTLNINLTPMPLKYIFRLS